MLFCFLAPYHENKMKKYVRKPFATSYCFLHAQKAKIYYLSARSKQIKKFTHVFCFYYRESTICNNNFIYYNFFSKFSAFRK